LPSARHVRRYVCEYNICPRRRLGEKEGGNASKSKLLVISKEWHVSPLSHKAGKDSNSDHDLAQPIVKS
jgi:hypothetical protein